MKPGKIAKTTASWHPDFRITAELPDTKIIRTSFLVNAVPASILILVLALLGHREMSMAAVRAEAKEIAAKIEAEKPRLAKAQEMQRQFSERETRFQEFRNFRPAGIGAGDFVALLGETLPRMVALDSVDAKPGQVILKGTLVGDSVRATSLANEYIDLLGKNEVVARHFESVKLVNLNRDKQTNRLMFEIALKPKTAAK